MNMHDFGRRIQKRNQIVNLGLRNFIKIVTRIEAYCVGLFVTLAVLVCNSGGGILTKFGEVSENDVPERQARMCHGVAKFCQN